MGQAQTAQTADAGAAKPVSGWRFKTAMVLFVVSLLGMPILVPLFAVLGFSATFMASFTAIGAVTAELLLVAGAAIAGKQGFAEIKRIVFQVFKRYGPPARVGKARYTLGLAMFVLPLVFGFVSPYLYEFDVGQYVPGLTENPFTYALAGDLIFVSSLFVLGGDFWDKLRSLFIHDALAVIPEKPAKSGAAA